MQQATKLTADQLKAANLHVTADKPGVICHIDGAQVHNVPHYIENNLTDWTVAMYLDVYGEDLPLYSETYLSTRANRVENIRTKMMAEVAALRPGNTGLGGSKKVDLAEVFGLAPSKALNKAGKPIQTTVLTDIDPNVAGFVPDIDEEYVFDAAILRDLNLGFELSLNILAWGLHGTGKTSVLEQFCARTGRPMIRIQHTDSTEEAHILGQYTLKDGSTVFEPGPLAVAMRQGLTYLADEYDFARPNVTAVYQPVLEGKSLVIKEAPPEWRVVKPHPNFRFAATGNTNGAGDDTGLYQGANIQNAANYSRFGVTLQINYMDAEHEAKVVVEKSNIDPADAKKLVELAGNIRNSFRRGELTATVSPRELINTAIIAYANGGDFGAGFKLAFVNRLSEVDRIACKEAIQRAFP